MGNARAVSHRKSGACAVGAPAGRRAYDPAQGVPLRRGVDDCGTRNDLGATGSSAEARWNPRSQEGKLRNLEAELGDPLTGSPSRSLMKWRSTDDRSTRGA